MHYHFFSIKLSEGVTSGSRVHTLVTDWSCSRRGWSGCTAGDRGPSRVTACVTRPRSWTASCSTRLHVRLDQRRALCEYRGVQTDVGIRRDPVVRTAFAYSPNQCVFATCCLFAEIIMNEYTMSAIFDWSTIVTSRVSMSVDSH